MEKGETKMELTCSKITRLALRTSPCSESKVSRLIPYLHQATFIGFSAAALLVLAFPAQGADSFTNGSFITPSPISTDIINRPLVIPPWKNTTDGIGCVVVNDTYLSVCGPPGSGRFSGSAFYSDPGPVPPGGNYVLIDGSPGKGPNTNTTVLYQTVTKLTKGRSYTVTFWQAAAQFVASSGGPTTEQWLVTFDSEYSPTTCNPSPIPFPTTDSSSSGPGYSCQNQLAPPMSAPGGSSGNDVWPWQKVTMTFVANFTKEMLGFFAGGAPGGAPPIDLLGGISVTPQDGYIKVCKESSTTNPVPAAGIYYFTVTGSAFDSSSNPLSVPVGECSGPIPATSPTATITELPTLARCWCQ